MSRRNRHDIMVRCLLERASKDPLLPPNAFKVLYFVAHLFNRKSKLAWPSERTIAEGTALTERSVRRMLKALADRRYIEIWVSRGRTWSNRYRPLAAPKNRTALSGFTEAKTVKTTPKSAIKRSTDVTAKSLKNNSLRRFMEVGDDSFYQKCATSASAPTHVVNARKSLQDNDKVHSVHGHQKPENRTAEVIKADGAVRQPSDEAACGTPRPASGALTGPAVSSAAALFGADFDGKWIGATKELPLWLPDGFTIGAKLKWEVDGSQCTILGFSANPVTTDCVLVRFADGAANDWVELKNLKLIEAVGHGFKLDDKAKHLRYGIGTVLDVEGNKIIVDFGQYGTKHILARFLEPVAAAA
jgi:hypothetical protein